MKNKKGFGKIEILIVMIVFLVVICFLITSFFSNSINTRYISMKQSASNFSYTVSTNINTFSDRLSVYLKEVIDEQLIDNIKNPITGGYCDFKESKIEFIDNKPYVTLKCGNYLIDKEKISANFDITIYEVSDWSLDKPSSESYDNRTLYTCSNNNKYNDNYEELYFLYMINKDYNKNYNNIREIDTSICNVVQKEYYRKKVIVKKM